MDIIVILLLVFLIGSFSYYMVPYIIEDYNKGKDKKIKLTKEEKREIRKRIKIFHPLFFNIKKVELKGYLFVEVSVKPIFSFSLGILLAPFVLIYMILSTIIDFIKTLPKEISGFASVSEIKTAVILKREKTLTDEEIEKIKNILG